MLAALEYIAARFAERMLVVGLRGRAAERFRARGCVVVRDSHEPDVIVSFLAALSDRPWLSPAAGSSGATGVAKRVLLSRGRWLTPGQWSVVEAVLAGCDSRSALSVRTGAPRCGLGKRIEAVLDAFDAVTLRELRLDLEAGMHGVGPYGSAA